MVNVFEFGEEAEFQKFEILIFIGSSRLSGLFGDFAKTLLGQLSYYFVGYLVYYNFYNWPKS
jgi:hypothetical protein